MRFFIAVNGYRTSTSDGFGNTWEVMECDDRKHQKLVLSRGLSVRDCQTIYGDNSRRPVFSTMGVRLATPDEIRDAKRDEERNGDAIQNCEPWRNVSMIDAT